MINNIKLFQSILNKPDNKTYLTATVSDLNPLKVKLYPGDDEILAIPTTNLWGVTVGSRVLLLRQGNQFICTSVIGSPKVDSITIKRTSNQLFTGTSNTKIAYDSEDQKVGSNLTYDAVNYGIEIGGGVSMVEAHAMTWANCEASGAYSAQYIYKNSSEATYSIERKRDTNSEKWRPHFGSVLIPVTEGDMIYCYIRFSVSDASNGVIGAYANSCKLMVRVVEYDLT
ncbi:MAG: hypothetical protein PVJ67_05075 [Candidatus Pacearchaeota archaeon]|jgi:hypothetical protein